MNLFIIQKYALLISSKEVISVWLYENWWLKCLESSTVVSEYELTIPYLWYKSMGLTI